MCWLCGEQVDLEADGKRDDWAATLDHVIPRSKGGTHDESNLKTAHRWCNSIRSDSGASSIWDLVS
nr:HNH endonuclease signature motif containing protein [Arthrobacter roseus]